MKRIPETLIFAIKIWGFLVLPAMLFLITGVYILVKSQKNSFKVYLHLPERYSALRTFVTEYKQVQLQLKQNKNRVLPDRLKNNPFFYPPLPSSSGKSFSKIPAFQKKFHLEMVFKFENTEKEFCVINDKLYKEGDEVFQGLKIKKIGDYYVELEAGKKVVRLKVGDTYLYTF